MRRTALAAAVLLLSAAAARAEVKIENIEACYGRFGPVRKTLEFYPDDEVFFRYLVTGIKPTAEGGVDGELTIALTSPDSKELLGKKSPASGVLALGGGALAGTASVSLPPGAAPGKYTFTVTFKDNQSNGTASFERELTLKPAEFRIVSPQFSYDREGKVPAPVGGLLGQTLFIRMKVIGFDRTRGSIDTDMRVQVLDAAGKETMPKPITARVRSDNAEVVKQASSVTFSAELVLNRTGQYTLRVTVTDQVGKKTTRLQAPLKVTAP
jgi:hypothetical protein